jgi:FlaA1/EpsC-like NDP-sugar epimerase
MFNPQSLLQNLGRLHDLCVAWVAFYLAFGITSNFNTLKSVPGIHEKALLFAFIAGCVNYFSALNRGTWRYASIPDLIAIVKSALLTAILYTIVLFMLSRADNLPRSVPPLAFVFCVFAMSGSRLLYRLFKEQGFFVQRIAYSVDRPKRNVLLLGVNNNAESFIRSVRRSETSEIHLIGILDNRLEKNLRVQGLRVFGTASSLGAVTRRLADRGIVVSELIITNPALPTSEVSSLLTQANRLSIKVSRIPDLSETSEINSIKPIVKKLELSDLLGRTEYGTESLEAKRLIHNRTVLITGAGGSIGSELARQVARFGSKSLIICDSSEYALYTIDTELRESNPDQQISAQIVDMRDRETVFRLFETHKPEVVFHAAALKHVPLMENNRLECLKTNVLGTRNVADAAVEHMADTFVLISTDKAVNPTNIMGASKRAAEVYCQARDLAKTQTRFKTVRFGNVLGSTGSVVPRFQKQIDEGGPVTVTHPEITRFFMTIPEAVRLVLQASADGLQRAADRGLILVLDMGKPIRIDELARKMIELSGLRPDIDIAVEYTGLRPGEKLYEELFDLQESSGSPNESGYFVAAPRVVPKETIDKALRGIESAVMAADEKKAIESLKIIVAEYQVQ